MSIYDSQNNPEVDVYAFMTRAVIETPLTEVLDGEEFTELTRIPVIGDRVCIGSNLLAARSDTERVSAQYALRYVSEELTVVVGEFRSQDGSGQAMRLGLTRGMGIDLQQVITPVHHDAYQLSMRQDGKVLRALKQDQETTLSVTNPASELTSPAELFARGCLYALKDILSRRQRTS